MLDVQFIRDNPELVAKKAKQKGIKVDVKELLELDVQRRKALVVIEELRQKRNEQAGATKGKKPSEAQIEDGKELKEKLVKHEAELEKIQTKYFEQLLIVPNVMPDDTPLGGEEQNKAEKHWGEPSKHKVQDHLKWGEQRGLIDFERGAKVAGTKFYFLKGSLVELELAVFQYTLQLAVKAGFTPMTVPHMVNSRTAAGTGFLPRGEERQIYKVEGEDLNLIATAELPITGYHADEILTDLPVLYAGLSPAYRMEAGAYGKHSRGLYRVHQFNKLELYVFCKPEESEKWHKKLIEIEEQICQDFGIPYQLVRIAAGDLGAPAYKKYDVNYWSPFDQSYHELMSCANVTDYQARRLNIRYKDDSGKTAYVHTLNATAAAFSRVCIALIENHQAEDGTVKVPKVLQPYMHNKETL
jgi:seryl-tRNA synthetase